VCVRARAIVFADEIIDVVAPGIPALIFYTTGQRQVMIPAVL